MVVTSNSVVQVNTNNSGSLEDPQIAVLPNGGWVVTWVSWNQDGDRTGVYLQAFNSDGSKRGGESAVNTYTIDDQNDPRIAALNDGGWVVTWNSDVQDNSSFSVYQQAFNADGTKRGSETRVNTYTPGGSDNPEVASTTDGGWVVTWRGWTREAGDESAIFGVNLQAYNADGSARGSNVFVGPEIPPPQIYFVSPQVIGLSDGGWVVTWDGPHDSLQEAIYQQAYNADQTKRGGEVQVNSPFASIKDPPRIIELSDGGWVVTWVSLRQDGSGDGVYMRTYNSDGSSRSGEVQVNSHTNLDQNRIDTTPLNDGGWVVTWKSYLQDKSGFGIYQQAYNSDGSPQGKEVLVNSYTQGSQLDPQVTALSNGGWAVVWFSSAHGDHDQGLYVQAYSSSGEPLGGELLIGNALTPNFDISALTGGRWIVTWSEGRSGSDVFQKVFSSDTVSGTSTIAQLFATNTDTAMSLTAAYEMLLAGVPNEAGFTFLINSAVSTNFGAGPGVVFNQENIFINMVNNLVQGNADAKARFDALATGSSLQEKVTSLYNAIIPASKQSTDGLAFITRADGLKFYQDVAAERGVAGTDGAAIVSMASLLKIAVTADYGIGNAVNDLIKAMAAGNAAIPASGTTLTPLETADGTAFDADDAAALARAATSAQREYASGDIGIELHEIAITGANDTSQSFDGF